MTIVWLKNFPTADGCCKLHATCGHGFWTSPDHCDHCVQVDFNTSILLIIKITITSLYKLFFFFLAGVFLEMLCIVLIWTNLPHYQTSGWLDFPDNNPDNNSAFCSSWGFRPTPSHSTSSSGGFPVFLLYVFVQGVPKKIMILFKSINQNYVYVQGVPKNS